MFFLLGATNWLRIPINYSTPLSNLQEIIAKNAKNWIKPDGKLYLEIGIDQAAEIKNIFISNGWDLRRSEYDLSGIERVLIFTLVQK